jgi:8-oxo-dGTP diphosphatase
MAERFTITPAVHVLLLHEGRVLLARRANTGYEDGRWSVPAGHVDGGETIREAAVREAAEELGVDLDLADVQFAHVMHRRKPDAEQEERIDFFLRCERWDGEVRRAEPDKCSELRWCDPNDLPDDTIAYVRAGIGHALAERPYAEHGWDPVA